MGDDNRAKKPVLSSSSSSSGCDVVLGLKTQVQRTESLPSKRTMAMPHPPLSPPPPPTFGSAAYGVNATTPPRSPHHHHHLLVLPPPSAKMPFTVTQWEELERQKMIYKYMTSSVPVPTELLLSPIIPTVKTHSDLVSSQSNSNTSGGLELKFSRSSDPEPWRCRRTDGKKWRCSRDVTPDQKYCERHAHKNRPRSRKPVESQTHNSSNSNSNSGILSNTLPANQVFQFSSSSSSSSAFGQTQKRSTNDWLSSYGQVQQWQQFHEEGEVDHDDDEQRRLREISHNWVSNDDHQYLSYISPGNSNQMMTTRHFIDAWPSSSTDHHKDHQDMVLNGDQDNENVNSQLGIGLFTQSPWLSTHQQPGGPLGEALCHNNNNAGGSAGGGGKSSGEDDGLGFPF